MRLPLLLMLAALAMPGGAAAGALTPDQSTLRTSLDTAFLKAGVRVTVEAISDPRGVTVPKGAKLPVLLIWNGYLSRPDIYQIQSKLDVIGEARKAAFGTVIFYSAGGTGSLYAFDVSRTGQTCSRDLCF